MKFGHKMTAVACAGALALMGVVPAFADTTSKDGSTAEVEIAAAVASSGEKIVSVTVPSQMAIAITTNGAADTPATPGTFKSYTGTTATVTNNAVSTNAVKVTVDSVSQQAGKDSSSTLLDLVNLTLEGDSDNSVVLSESTKGVALFNSIGVGGSYPLSLTAAAKDASTEIPTDSYAVNAVLKVTAI